MPSTEIRVTCTQGKMRFIYDDALADVVRAGDFIVTRASHVEPHPTKSGWLADMRPSGGPVLGRDADVSAFAMAHSTADWTTKSVDALEGFPTRQAALDAEVAWLRQNRGL